jgi:[ribosomal protein S5]-alanine N-acetyltransferase
MQKNANEQVKILETERMWLRHLCADDAGFLVELLNEAGFRQNVGDRGVRNTVDACRYILTGPVASYQQFGFGMYLVELKETGAPLGICGLLKRDSTEEIEIGFAYLERFWGKGYAYEAAAALMDYARRSLRLKRIAATTVPGNRGSIRILEKLGLRFERMIRMEGQEQEISLYALEE